MFKLKGLDCQSWGTMKEALELVDKFQADLNATLTSNLNLEGRAKSVEDQVALFQCQVLELQTQAQEAQATSTRVAELETELKETVAQGGEM